MAFGRSINALRKQATRKKQENLMTTNGFNITRTSRVLALAALFCTSLQFSVAQERSQVAPPPTDTTNHVAKFTNSSGDLTNSQIFDSGTFVGVGTNSPVSKLHVSGAGTSGNQTQAAVEISNTASGGGSWWLRSAATGNNTAAGTFSIGNNDAYWVVVTSNGNVGLGFDVTDPQYALQMGDGAYETGGTWTNASDKNLKENFGQVDDSQLLSKINSMSIQTWNYKNESKSVRHLGPVAQDFYSAFALGHDDKHISTVDEGGVALAGVQGLYRMLLQKNGEVAALTQANQDKDAKIQELQVKVDKLQQLEQTVQILSTKLSKIEGENTGSNILKASR
jgi:hypothetical protein